MNLRMQMIVEALNEGHAVPVDMVMELTDYGMDISDLVDHIDGFTTEEY